MANLLLFVKINTFSYDNCNLANSWPWAVLVTITQWVPQSKYPFTHDALYAKYIQYDKKISFVVKELIVNLNFLIMGDVSYIPYMMQSYHDMIVIELKPHYNAQGLHKLCLFPSES